MDQQRSEFERAVLVNLLEHAIEDIASDVRIDTYPIGFLEASFSRDVALYLLHGMRLVARYSMGLGPPLDNEHAKRQYQKLMLHISEFADRAQKSDRYLPDIESDDDEPDYA